MICIQEVQRRQARRLAAELGWSHVWSFKHWPVIHPAEGLAVLAPPPVRLVVAAALNHRWRWWSWRRRLAQVVDLGPAAVTVVNVHLSPHALDRARAAEIDRLVAVARARDAIVVAGDLNAAAEAGELAALQDHDFRVVDGGWLDHVAVRRPRTATVVAVADPGLSDHPPVVVDVTDR